MWHHMKKSLKISTSFDEPPRRNIHKSIKFVLIIAQCFGFFPVQDLFSTNPNRLSFRWWSCRVFMSIVTSFLAYSVALGHLTHMASFGYNQFDMNGIIFWGVGATSCLLFIKMAKDWGLILRKWHEIDCSMASYGWPKMLDRRLKIITTIFLTLEAIEHFTIQANKFIVSVQCKGSIAEGFEHFCVNMSFFVIFDILPYNSWLGITLQVINTRMAFSWTFLDLFIILLSCAMALRFRQINQRLQYMREMKVKYESNWMSVYTDYNRLCRFCRFLDDKMSWLILLSFFNNVYYIIFQVYDSFTLHQATLLETLYFFISMSLLILRMVSICLYGSWVNEESKEPIHILATMPYDIYNKEIERFIEIVEHDNAGFTGRRLFRITKTLLLKISTAVVTYELVVIQFNKNLPKKDSPSLNSIC